MSDKVTVTMDRPIGYKDNYGNIYTVNYGYIEGIMSPDGEEQDAYVLDRKMNYPIDKYVGNVIAIIEREADVETKWIVSNETWSVEEIWEKVNFIEKHFKVFCIKSKKAL